MSYRNDLLLKLAAVVPECMRCGASNEGQVVACHSNQIRDGKGMGIKAHDLPAYLCTRCHDLVDGRTHPELTPNERELEHKRGVYRSWLWLQGSEFLVLDEDRARFALCERRDLL